MAFFSPVLDEFVVQFLLIIMIHVMFLTRNASKVQLDIQSGNVMMILLALVNSVLKSLLNAFTHTQNTPVELSSRFH